jgi:hypothetical protein
MQTQPELKPEAKQLIAHTDAILAEAETYKVATAQQFADAGDVLKRIKSHQKKLDESESDITRPINAGLKAVRDLFRGPKERAARAESLVKRAMIAFSDEQERIRRVEQAKADELARKERERIEAQAKKAAESGKTEKAEALEQRAATVVAPIIQREPPKVSGVNFRETWKFEVENEELVPREYLSVDEKKIRAVVNALKGGTQIPGVRVYSEKNLAAGAA